MPNFSKYRRLATPTDRGRHLRPVATFLAAGKQTATAGFPHDLRQLANDMPCTSYRTATSSRLGNLVGRINTLAPSDSAFSTEDATSRPRRTVQNSASAAAPARYLMDFMPGSDMDLPVAHRQVRRSSAGPGAFPLPRFAP